MRATHRGSARAWRGRSWRASWALPHHARATIVRQTTPQSPAVRPRRTRQLSGGRLFVRRHIPPRHSSWIGPVHGPRYKRQPISLSSYESMTRAAVTWHGTALARAPWCQHKSHVELPRARVAAVSRDRRDLRRAQRCWLSVATPNSVRGLDHERNCVPHGGRHPPPGCAILGTPGGRAAQYAKPVVRPPTSTSLLPLPWLARAVGRHTGHAVRKHESSIARYSWASSALLEPRILSPQASAISSSRSQHQPPIACKR